MTTSTNFLIKEKSPYLQQHAHNPVAWYPWGDEPFNRAKKENKPVFLSIGYSTCHWCHVMEKESFEDMEVAEAMNNTFISIKVDREERPDLDSLYMSVCQMMTGSGGWPLNLVLTPDRKPVFAFTYLPKHSRRNMMGIIELCKSVQELWNSRKDELIDQGKKVLDAISNATASREENPISTDLLNGAYTELQSAFDPQYGGFGFSPKFPSPHYMLFLLRYYHRFGDSNALSMVEKTVDGMLAGGINDHLGHGFHRYSTDHEWKIPHFEKMLYDQAMILASLADLYAATRKKKYLNAMQDILFFLREEMKKSGSAYRTAIDADSEGQEGKYYTWTTGELLSVLGQRDAEIFSYVYGALPDGNFHEEASGRVTARNILYVANKPENAAENFGMTLEEVNSILKRCKKRLISARSRRIAPHKDDKILSDMNGLLLWAFSKCYLASGNDEFLTEAKTIAAFLLDKMVHSDGGIMHRFIDDRADIPGFLDDYAFAISGFLKLYEASGEEMHFKTAKLMQDYLDKHFLFEGGGYYTTEMNDAPLRTKEFHDGAIPGGNSFELQNLLTFAIILGRNDLYEAAVKIAEAAGKSLQTNPTFHLFMLSAIDFAIGPSFDLVVPDPLSTNEIKVFSSVYEPRVIISHMLNSRKDLEEATLKSGSSILVCSMKECFLPQTDIKAALSLIEKVRAAS